MIDVYRACCIICKENIRLIAVHIVIRFVIRILKGG